MHMYVYKHRPGRTQLTPLLFFNTKKRKKNEIPLPANNNYYIMCILNMANYSNTDNPQERHAVRPCRRRTAFPSLA